jgi:hypothetical protein
MNRNTNNRKRVHEQREIVQENKRFCLREELEEGEIVQENKRVCLREELEEGEIVQENKRICLREELEEGEIVQENKRVCLREELEEGEIAQEKVIQISKELPDIVDEIRDNYYGLDCGNTLCFEYLVTLKGIDVFTTKVKYQYGLCSRNENHPWIYENSVYTKNAPVYKIFDKDENIICIVKCEESGNKDLSLFAIEQRLKSAAYFGSFDRSHGTAYIYTCEKVLYHCERNKYYIRDKIKNLENIYYYQISNIKKWMF